MNNTIKLTQESELATKFPNIIEPFWDEHVTKMHFDGVKGVSIFAAYVVHPEAKGSIVLSGGRTEAAVKYKELIYDLYQNGYSVFTADHRGQGQSGRMNNNPNKGYVDDFQDYVTDFKTFYDEIVAPNSAHKPMLLCHSMGSAIGALYLITHPDDFAKATLGSPMFGIKAPIPLPVAKVIISAGLGLNSIVSSSPWYFIGQGNYKYQGFDGNPITQSQARYDIHNQVFEDYPETRLGGVTMHWLSKALFAMNYILENADKIKTPTLVLQAGADSIIDNKSHKPVCDRIPQCRFEIINKARHELLMEKDEYRNPALQKALSFFAEE
ncbi:alpha/beta fold hydrolase [Paraneptunicella aestuarii]|uniref:alpha/beta fold hydrolase n=1 Tax=Paraneptunicella aestuarii TaxID=2831148 RepID=UPI001E394168|nr:alpha/beta fold hydrolase [Paraneptunicella aestuarii]UAA39209.1 alpha/beta fold hydrolase [Paraneptunicella aestuarii]